MVVSRSRRLRRVLLVEDEACVRNVLHVLLAEKGCECDAAYSGHQALARIQRESYDAMFLDLRCSEMAPEQIVTHIKNVTPSLVGRVLFITVEVTDPEVLKTLERQSVPCVSRNHLMEDLWIALRTLFGLPRKTQPASRL